MISICIVVGSVGVGDWIHNFVIIFDAWKIHSMYQLSRILIVYWVYSEWMMIKATCLLQELGQIRKEQQQQKWQNQNPVKSTISHCLYKHGDVSVFSRTSCRNKTKQKTSSTEALLHKTILKKGKNNNKRKRWRETGRQRERETESRKRGEGGRNG